MPPDMIDLTSKGIALASADYRMYPNAKYPDFIEDTVSAIAFLKEFGEHQKIFSDLYVGGSSAGAYLTMMAYFDSRYLERHGIKPDDIRGWFFDAGQPTVHFNVLRERGMDTRLVRIDEAAPLYFVDRDKETANPSKLMFIVSEHDIENRLEQIRLMLKTLEIFGYDMSRVTFKLMTGYEHCGYAIAGMVTDFILH